MLLALEVPVCKPKGVAFTLRLLYKESFPMSTSTIQQSSSLAQSWLIKESEERKTSAHIH